MPAPMLSIVAPVYNEACVLPELVARCTRAAAQRQWPFEMVLIDDASTDDTPLLLDGLARDKGVHFCRLPTNVGQFRATQAGLSEARGMWVLVLDGDLQDPPEDIPRLVDALSEAPPYVLAVLAVKWRRDDPLVFMLGQVLFHRLQHAFSRVSWPPGVGSYCVMRRAVARRVARVTLRRANLAAVIAVAVHALGGELATIAYDKGPRYDRRTRVGWRGLIAEALGSLAVTGALVRMLALAAGVLGVGGWMIRDYPLGRWVVVGGGVFAATLALWLTWRVEQALAPLRARDDSG